MTISSDDFVSKLPQLYPGLLYALWRAVVISNELLIPIHRHLSSLPWGRGRIWVESTRAASDAKTPPPSRDGRRSHITTEVGKIHRLSRLSRWHGAAEDMNSVSSFSGPGSMFENVIKSNKNSSNVTCCVFSSLHIETVFFRDLPWIYLTWTSGFLSNALFQLPHPFFLKQTLKLKMRFFGANLKRFKKRKPIKPIPKMHLTGFGSTCTSMYNSSAFCGASASTKTGSHCSLPPRRLGWP